MLKKPSCLLAMVLLCGIGHAGESKPDAARFIGHLRQATVELVGVTSWPPTAESRWWRPDGSVAEIGPHLWQKRNVVGGRLNWGTREEVFLPKRKSDNVLHIGQGQTGVTFLIRISRQSSNQSSYGDDRYDPPPADTSRPAKYQPSERPSYGQEGGNRSAGDLLRPVYQFRPRGRSPEVDEVASVRTGITSRRKNIFAPAWGSDMVVDADGHVVPDHTLFSAVVAKPAETAVLRVGVSKEAWETVASQTPDRGGSSNFDRYGRQWTVVFDKAEARGPRDQTQVRLKTTFSGYKAYNEVTQRLVAVTSDEKEHAPRGEVGDWENGRTITYDLPLPSIKEFRFQVSPYDWVEFDKISLQLGQKTAVRVRSLKVPLAGLK
jgi:hypothetical protein